MNYGMKVYSLLGGPISGGRYSEAAVTTGLTVIKCLICKNDFKELTSSFLSYYFQSQDDEDGSKATNFPFASSSTKLFTISLYSQTESY